jgi:hypothetical protein
MNARDKAAAIANQFEGRCTCATMDGGVDCPWCQVFYEVLQGFPLVPVPARPAPGRAPSLSISP